MFNTQRINKIDLFCFGNFKSPLVPFKARKPAAVCKTRVQRQSWVGKKLVAGPFLDAERHKHSLCWFPKSQLAAAIYIPIKTKSGGFRSMETGAPTQGHSHFFQKTIRCWGVSFVCRGVFLIASPAAPLPGTWLLVPAKAGDLRIHGWLFLKPARKKDGSSLTGAFFGFPLAGAKAP